MAKSKIRNSRPEEFKRLKHHLTGNPIDVYTREGKETVAPPTMPTSVIILGMHFNIRYHSKIYAERKEKTRLWGCVLYWDQTIFLASEAALPQMRKTLYHEVSHVFLEKANIKGLSAAQVEELCDVFGEAVVDLATNNRSLV